MINHGLVSHCEIYFLNMKINHSPMSHCDKDGLDMRINNRQPYLL